jgi:hypothetical protein
MHFDLSGKHGKLMITLLAGGLGNILAYLSTLLISPQPQIAFDLSHLATFAIAIYFGPYYGLLTGAIVAIYPYINLGVLGAYGPFVGIPIFIGKAMTGYFCGVLARKMRPYLAIPLSYIPESLFTLVFLKAVQVWMLPDLMTWNTISDILIKGWVEVLILSFILETVSRRHVLETAVLLLEIFIITLLVHGQETHTLALLLVIVFVIMITIDLIGRHRGNDKKDANSFN